MCEVEGLGRYVIVVMRVIPLPSAWRWKCKDLGTWVLEDHHVASDRKY